MEAAEGLGRGARAVTARMHAGRGGRAGRGIAAPRLSDEAPRGSSFEGAPQDPSCSHLLAQTRIPPLDEPDRAAAPEAIGELHVLEEREGLEAPHREIVRRPDGERRVSEDHSASDPAVGCPLDPAERSPRRVHALPHASRHEQGIREGVPDERQRPVAGEAVGVQEEEHVQPLLEPLGGRHQLRRARAPFQQQGAVLPGHLTGAVGRPIGDHHVGPVRSLPSGAGAAARAHPPRRGRRSPRRGAGAARGAPRRCSRP